MKITAALCNVLINYKSEEHKGLPRYIYQHRLISLRLFAVDGIIVDDKDSGPPDLCHHSQLLCQPLPTVQCSSMAGWVLMLLILSKPTPTANACKTSLLINNQI